MIYLPVEDSKLSSPPHRGDTIELKHVYIASAMQDRRLLIIVAHGGQIMLILDFR